MGAPHNKKNTKKHKQFTKAKISKASDTITKLLKLVGHNNIQRAVKIRPRKSQ